MVPLDQLHILLLISRIKLSKGKVRELRLEKRLPSVPVGNGLHSNPLSLSAAPIAPSLGRLDIDDDNDDDGVLLF